MHTRTQTGAAALAGAKEARVRREANDGRGFDGRGGGGDGCAAGARPLSLIISSSTDSDDDGLCFLCIYVRFYQKRLDVPVVAYLE